MDEKGTGCGENITCRRKYQLSLYLLCAELINGHINVGTWGFQGITKDEARTEGEQVWSEAKAQRVGRRRRLKMRCTQNRKTCRGWRSLCGAWGCWYRGILSSLLWAMSPTDQERGNARSDSWQHGEMGSGLKVDEHQLSCPLLCCCRKSPYSKCT